MENVITLHLIVYMIVEVILRFNAQIISHLCVQLDNVWEI